MRLALGTAQLGMPYGIANHLGQPDGDEALAIVETAWRGGVRFFDTAQAYGTSQQVLGQCFRKLEISDRVWVVSKLDPSTPTDDPVAIRRAVESSLRTLGVPSLWAFLLHREDLLDLWRGPLGSCLNDLRNEGLIHHLGVSLYTPEATRRALDIAELEVLQVPASVFDRRLARSGLLARCAQAGRRVFLRSVYLQGLALMPAAELPPPLHFAHSAVAAYEEFCHTHGLDRRAFALSYARHLAPGAHLVVGAESHQQCTENCRLMGTVVGDPEAWDRRWPTDDPRLVDPSSWFEAPA